jgi:hypothetical protein
MEARNTFKKEDRYDSETPGGRLRDKTITFVSAGSLHREHSPPTTPEETEAKNDEQEESIERDAAVKDVPQLDIRPLSPATHDVPHKPAEVLQLVQAPPQVPDPSSDSDSEEIVFAGRNASRQPICRNTPSLPVQLAPVLPTPHVAASAGESKPAETIGQAVKPAKPPKLVHSSSDDDTGLQDTPPTRPPRRWETRHERRVRLQQEEEDAMMQDYIDNMALDDDNDDDEENQAVGNDALADHSSKPATRKEHFRFHKSSGEENSKVQLRSGQKTRVVQNTIDISDWDSADLDDFNDLSTTDEDVAEVGRVLRHRSRPRGRQYLVTAVGSDVGEAKWIAHTKLISTTAVEQIRLYEDIREARSALSFDESTSEGDDPEELEDLADEIASEHDENNRIIDRVARMTDEQLARAYAKQQELGIDGDELQLFGADDDDFDLDNDFTVDEFMNGDSFIPFSVSKHTSNRGRSKRNKRTRDSFPSAGALADAIDQDPYGGFDVMDFDRPSLRPKRKGRKSDFPYDLEDVDTELAEQLVNTWTKDRDKKAARKREKQEAREAMLLEAAEGSTPSVIKLRIRQFLMSESDTLELSPMDSAMRAGVHRLAKALTIKSGSRGKEGKGAGRYPVLTKTPYTKHYDSDNIWEIDALLESRKFWPKGFNRGPTIPRSGVATARRGRGGGGGFGAASYMNGDVVGAAAPEIGSENRGRALLEKMGWKSGMGIGREGNEGSIDVIKHVVKTNKAGLG